MGVRFGQGLRVLIGLAAAASGSAHMWVRDGRTPRTRHQHAMVYDGARGRLVVVGGAYGDLGDPAWEFDATNGWSRGARIPSAMGTQTGHTMCWDQGRGRVVLFGSVQTRDRTWEYDGAAWTPGPLAPPAVAGRSGAAMAYDVLRARVVLFGGFGTSYLDDTWYYDGTAWVQGPAAPAGLVARQFHAMTFDTTRGRTVLFGGEVSLASFLDDTWLLDGSSWSPGPPPAPGMSARVGHAIAHDGVRGVVVLHGGSTGSTTLGDVWEYDGFQWSAGAAPPASMLPRMQLAMAYDAGRSRIVVYGGLNGYNTLLGDMWEYDGARWKLAADTIPPRTGHAMAFDAARGRAVVFGGRLTNGGLRLRDTWELAGSRWVRGAPAPLALTPRDGHAMCYDERRSRTVLVGGDDGAPRADVWEYDGTSWTPAAAAPLPPRRAHAMAFDAIRGMTIVHGGSDSAVSLDDTWYYDGTSWTPGPAGPSAREGHAMAFDRTRGRTVLFGGRFGGTLDDTWEHDGVAWSPVATNPSPSPRSAHAMAYDSSTGRVILFGGGATSGGSFGDTWAFSGTWQKAAIQAGKPLHLNRSGHGMVLDAGAPALVVFGGEEWHSPSSTGTVDDTLRFLPVASHVVGAGAGQQNGNRVRAFDGGLATPTDFVAYAAGQWGADVATGHVESTPRSEILTGPGPGPALGPIVRGWRATGAAIAKINFFAYGTLAYGVNVHAGRIDGDAWDEILTAPGPGTVFGPQVRGFDFDGSALQAIAKVNFYAYATLRYGATCGHGDVDADGFHEILTGPGPSPAFAPLVRAFDYDGAVLSALAKINFWAFTTPQYGVRVAGGDVEGDGFHELACTPGAGASRPAQFLGYDYDGAAVSPVPGFDLTIWGSYGGRVATGAVGDGAPDDLIAARGPDPAQATVVWTYAFDQGGLDFIHTFQPFPSPAAHGSNVSAGDLGF